MKKRSVGNHTNAGCSVFGCGEEEFASEKTSDLPAIWIPNEDELEGRGKVKGIDSPLSLTYKSREVCFCELKQLRIQRRDKIYGKTEWALFAGFRGWVYNLSAYQVGDTNRPPEELRNIVSQVLNCSPVKESRFRRLWSH